MVAPFKSHIPLLLDIPEFPQLSRGRQRDWDERQSKTTRNPIMKRHVLMGLIAGMIFGAGNAGAKEVRLDMGETYRQGDLTVTCGESSGESSTDNPLALNDCQYWDDFNKECLFEKTTYMYKNLKCVEECQYWDKFNGICHYRTKCTFSPPHKAFVRTTCEKFDDFNNTCVKTMDTKIGF